MCKVWFFNGGGGITYHGIKDDKYQTILQFENIRIEECVKFIKSSYYCYNLISGMGSKLITHGPVSIEQQYSVG